MDRSDGSESDLRSNISSSSRDERRRVLLDRADNNYGTRFINKGKNSAVDSSVVERQDNLYIAEDFEVSKMYNEDEIVLQRSDHMMDFRYVERSRMEGFRGARRMDVEGTRYATLTYSDEGPSSNQLRSNYVYEVQGKNKNEMSEFKDRVDLDRGTLRRGSYAGSENRSQIRRARRMDVEGMRYASSMYSEEEGPLDNKSSFNYDYGDPLRNKIGMDRFNNVDYVREDRADLLRKLDELTDRLSRSGETFPLDRRAIHQDPYAGSEKWFSDTSLEMQFLHPDKQFGRRPYPNSYAEPSTMMRRQEKGRLGFCPPRGPRRIPAPCRQPPSHAYFSGEYMDRMEPYPPNVSHHHPSCSCFRCHNKRQVSPQVRFSDIPENLAFNRYKNSSSIDDSRTTIPPPLKSENPQSQRRLPSDLNSEVDDFIHSRPSRSRPVSRGRSIGPIAGGAPFFTCYNCFEVLQLPKKVTVEDRKQNRTRCGACSTIIALAFTDKKLLLINVEEENTLAEVDDSHVVSEPRNSHVHRHLNQASTTFSSYDYDNSGYDSLSMDREPGSAEMKNPHNTSSEGDEVMPSKNRAEQSSMKSTSAATEIDFSTNEYSNTGTSLESGEGDRLRGNTAAESYYAGIMEKISMHSNESNLPVEPEKSEVTVNGHRIPDRSIKKAERLAGPIHPGHYWYDFRAGFWGVDGGPCLGIIPPYILEFNYPMSENCSGGDTTVFVNGRELHKNDFNLLGSRGLPTDRNRSYIVEISGRIRDDHSGEELKSLQKLAPTVEKANRGFGMRASKVAA